MVGPNVRQEGPNFSVRVAWRVSKCVTAKRKERRKAKGKTRKETRKEEQVVECTSTTSN